MSILTTIDKAARDTIREEMRRFMRIELKAVLKEQGLSMEEFNDASTRIDDLAATRISDALKVGLDGAIKEVERTAPRLGLARIVIKYTKEVFSELDTAEKMIAFLRE